MKPQRIYVLNCIGVTLLCCAAGALAIRANTIARLRGANERLRGSEREIQELSRQNQEIPRLRAQMAAIVRLRTANKDLFAIRNEIRQLRGRKEELAEARAENEVLLAAQQALKGQPGASVPPAGAITRAALIDAGLGSPEATVQTFFWAICRGNLERMAQCKTVRWPDMTAADESAQKLVHAKDMLQQVGFKVQGQSTEELRQGLLAQTQYFPGYRITAQKSVGPHEVEIAVQCVNGGELMTMRLSSGANVVTPIPSPGAVNDEWTIGQ